MTQHIKQHLTNHYQCYPCPGGEPIGLLLLLAPPNGAAGEKRRDGAPEPGRDSGSVILGIGQDDADPHRDASERGPRGVRPY